MKKKFGVGISISISVSKSESGSGISGADLGPEVELRRVCWGMVMVVGGRVRLGGTKAAAARSESTVG